ncbi:pyrimidine reductase [Saccharothrix sp. ALI-22-I]|uniref:dihydrofolate reductase family protein n=1 Tax=Saccharothrix sp. ALI-22-I TaxID=1933778 RepID=UPI00097C64C0|nr:dihydrofolate reductase family protein [Saccharothrix sp. ALI-22-I]ONI80339.1 pyrimidine reductase [Saccharothrix sp. ALI-22-I]
MRKIVAWLFITLDGVVESPEKWVMYNDEIGETIGADAEAADTLLLGRRTYEVFAASWPQRTIEDDPFADWMNNTPKLVASTTLDSTDWQNTTVIKGDLAEELRALKAQPGRNILVNGSPTLVQWLLHNNLLDELRLFQHPIVAGGGKRLFTDSGKKMTLTLSHSHVLSTGVLDLTYAPNTA